MGLLTADSITPPGLWATVRAELRNPCGPTAQKWYSFRDQVNARVLDLRGTFAPTGARVLFSKALMSLLAMISLAFCLWQTDIDRRWYFTYFSHLSLAVQTIYHVLSFCVSAFPLSVTQPKDDDDAVPRQCRLIWFLFNLSLHASLTATLLYWTYGPRQLDDVHHILPHGPVAILTFLDGLIINRIPIRLFHWWSAVLPFQLLWLGWTLVEAYVQRVDLGGNHNDDHVVVAYVSQQIDWQDNLWGTVLFFAMVILVEGPLLQFCLFLCSLYAWPLCCRNDRRRYMTIDTTSSSTDEEAAIELKSTTAESVSIFAGWGN